MEHVTEGCQCEGKTCKACQNIKCIGCYNRYSKNNPTLKARCRPCDNEQKYAWAKSHPESVQRSQKKQLEKKRPLHVSENLKMRKRANAHKWRKEHPERSRANTQKWKEEHPERVRANAHKWKKEHPEYQRKYTLCYKPTPARLASYQRYRSQFKLNRPQDYRAQAQVRDAKRRAREVQALGSHTRKEWQQLKAHYQYTCLCCGKCEPEIKLTLDHVIPLSKNGTNSISNIQPLCHSCNSRKKDKIYDFRPPTT